jgi:hypothetical protein
MRFSGNTATAGLFPQESELRHWALSSDVIGEELWAEGLLKPVLLGFPRLCQCRLSDVAQNAITAQLSGLMGQ